MENAIKSLMKNGEHIKSVKYKEKDGMKKLKVKFDSSNAKNVAIKKKLMGKSY